MAHLQITLFGKPQIHHGERPVSFRTRKALALLIYLVVEGGSHSREKLATLLWPESDPQASRATLRSTLRYLRRGLEHAPDSKARPHLNVSRDALSFNFDSDHELDLHVVERTLDKVDGSHPDDSRSLQKAVSLQRGPFLEGFSLSDAPRFDDWARIQGEVWHLRISDVFDHLSQIQERAGETSSAIETTTRWLGFEPLKEAAYRRLMRLQWSQGDRSGALQTYEKCRQTLHEELGVQPAPETRALAGRIEDAPAARNAASVNRGPASRTPAEAATQQDRSGDEKDDLPPSLAKLDARFPFVGRGDQHTRLVEAYYRVRDERAQVVIVEGEAGIGKTRLVREFARWASAREAQILQGRAFETGGRLPYQPLVDAFRPLTPRMPDLLSPTWLGELTRILPELNDLVHELPAPTTDENLGRSRLFEAIARLGSELAARTPLVLFLDDLQWADAATLDMLTYITRRWSEQQAPVLLLGAVRSEALHRMAPDDALREWSSALQRDPGLTRLQLSSLSQSEITDFVKDIIHRGDQLVQVEQFGGWLFQETQGQPFYLTQTIKALLEEGILVSRPQSSEQAGIEFSARVADALSWSEADPLEGFVPPGVRDVVRNRLARLSPVAFDLLVAAAILGQNVDFQGLCRIAGLPRDEALPLLDNLLATRLLAESTREGRPYNFAHDKIRDVVYTEAGDARRQLFHERALEYLQEMAAPAAQLAHHAHRAGDYRAAFRHSLQAGDDAMAAFAVDDALYHFERAHRALSENLHRSADVELSRRRHLYERLGRGYELVNDWTAAREIYEEMLDDARDAQQPGMEVAALNRLATIQIIWRLDPDGALSVVEEARTVAEASGDRRGLAEAEWNACLANFYRFERPPALAHGERAIALAREIGERELIAKCLNATGYAAAGVNLWHRVKEYGEEAQEKYAAMGNRALEVDSLLLVAFARINDRDTAGGVADAREAVQISREIENVWGEANGRNHLAAGLLDLGDYGAAFHTVQKVFTLPQLEEAPQFMAAFTVRGMAYRALQDFEKALADHVQAQEHIFRLGNPGMRRVLSAHLCADYALLGRWEKAHEEARVAMRTKDFGWYYAGFHYWSVTEALLQGGDEEDATKDVERLDDAVGHYPRYRVVVERSKAVLKEWHEDYEGATAHLNNALQEAQALSLPGEQWPVLLALAELADRMGEEETAVSHRQQARQVIDYLAAQIDDPELREEFRARPVKRV